MAITLAIPNFNGFPYLKNLIPQVTKEHFDQIYVLDDHSNDQSLEFLQNYPDIKIVCGASNLKPTANRNRLLKEDFGDIVVFLDVDMEIVTHDMAAAVKDLFAKNPDTAVFGGLIVDKAGQPMQYNYGDFPSPWGDIKTNFWNILARGVFNNLLTRPLWQKAKQITDRWYTPTEKEVDWVAEGFCMIRGDVFRKLQGFDEDFKMFYEGPDFCKRAIEAGYKVRFTPQVKVKHMGYKSVSSSDRLKNVILSISVWYKKHYRPF